MFLPLKLSPSQTLSLDDKFRIASGEVETLNKDIEKTRKTSEQNLDVLKALMEETDIRIAELKRSAYEFRRDIVVGAENPRTGKTMAEKVGSFWESWRSDVERRTWWRNI